MPAALPASATPAGTTPPAAVRRGAFYFVVGLQTLAILIAAILVYRLAATLHAVEGRLDQSLAAARAESVPPHPAPASPDPGMEPADAQAGSLTAAPAATVKPLPSELAIRDGIILRGRPVTIRGRAPYGAVVALAADGKIVATALVEDTAFEFVDVALTPGPHSLSVVAFSLAGPASASPPVSIRYEASGVAVK